jgi:outer membrane protein assembly factor BamD (BamD/ComL family)
MKKLGLSITALGMFLLLSMTGTVQGQGGTGREAPPPKTKPTAAKKTPPAKTDSATTGMGDADVEADAYHNLEVARHYFKLRKAYVAALERCEEIIAGNPTFSRIDEVLYMAGESSLNLAEGKGKQKPALYVIREGDTKKTLTPDEFRELARDYLSQLVNSYPQSSFRGQAEEALKMLGGAKPKSGGQ